VPKSWKKVQFLCNLIWAVMSHICPIKSGKNPLLRLFCSIFPKKVQFFCQFLCKTMCHICPIFRPDFAQKVRISSILSTFSEKSWKKVQFFAIFCTNKSDRISVHILKKVQFLFSKWCAVMSYFFTDFRTKSRYFLGNTHFLRKKFKKSAIFCTNIF